MKMTIRVFSIAIGFAMLLTLSACQDSGPPALNINDLAADPAAFSGTLTVTGILGAYSQNDPQIFGVMDKSELQCTSPNCNKFYLPVRYTGKIPAHGDELVITGSFVSGSALFAATELKVVDNHEL